ncbi:DUF2971 domain-containing protein [Bifidobacterium sp.]|uniref:DUF2971 domain-containing protein n=1 Tax=Bifidobacterium sp. TaxID=41200 RepID=UPI0025BFEBAF|nr:DUF2971 domain-containing protein [Bifidobacterium sp.]MCI1634850.1 DUF2971 domain-containing protein [Bifidobacterium sp.]
MSKSEVFADKLRRLTNRAIYRDSMCKELGVSVTECRQLLFESANSQIPDTLFKMSGTDDDRNFNRRLEDLRKKRLHMSSPKAFNDPFDCQPFWDKDKIQSRLRRTINPDDLRTTINFHKRYILPDDRAQYELAMNTLMANLSKRKQAEIDRTLNEIQASYENIRESYRCSCLTEEKSLGPMWANYADNGRGFMTAYSAQDLELDCIYRSSKAFCGGSPFCFLLPVIYTGRYDLSQFSSVIGGSEQWYSYQTEMALLTFINSVAYKTPEWSYEKEWRIACSDCPKEEQVYASLAATALYIGYNTPKDRTEQLEACARELSIPVYQAEISTDSAKGRLLFRLLNS